MSLLLDKYLSYHGLGSHCTTTILRTLTNAAGYNFTEAYCLGLSSGLGYTYQKYVGLDYNFFTGRNENLEENLVNVLGGKLIKGTTDDPADGWEQVKTMLDHHVPIVLEVDMMKLEYIRKAIDLKKEFHFGLHSVLLVGYDESSAYLLDYMWQQPIKVSLKELENARNSQEAPIKPLNRWKALFIQNNDTFDLKFATLQAIQINVHKYLQPYAFKMGLEGLEMFARELELWFKTKKIEELRNNFYMAYALFEKVGTGGGNFRRMYARFIDEANRVMPRQEFAALSKIYSELFRLWRSFSNLLAKLSELDAMDEMYTYQPEVLRQINEICEKEKTGINLLREMK